jgi:uncharacterized protein YraI
MFLAIVFIILCLAGIALVLLKWKGSVSLIPLGLCMAGIILVIFLNTDEKKKEQKTKKIRDLNLIEYVDYLQNSKRQYDLSDAISTANVNMRTQAGRNGEIILSIPEGAQIRLNASDHQHGWFTVAYNGESGWVYGKYLQALPGFTSRQSTTQVNRISLLFYAFPERTWWGILLGLFIGITISMYMALLGYSDMLSSKRFGISYAYFIIKDLYIFIENYPNMLGFGGLAAILLASVVMAFVTNALANIALNLIDQYRVKALSQ